MNSKKGLSQKLAEVQNYKSGYFCDNEFLENPFKVNNSFSNQYILQNMFESWSNFPILRINIFRILELEPFIQLISLWRNNQLNIMHKKIVFYFFLQFHLWIKKKIIFQFNLSFTPTTYCFYQKFQGCINKLIIIQIGFPVHWKLRCQTVNNWWIFWT